MKKIIIFVVFVVVVLYLGTGKKPELRNSNLDKGDYVTYDDLINYNPDEDYYPINEW